MSDMVVDVVGMGNTGADPLRRGMKSRGHSQLNALGPYGVVVVFTVQTQRIWPEDTPAGIAQVGDPRNRPTNETSHQHRFQPQHLGEIELLNRLFRAIHWNTSDRYQPVVKTAKQVSDHNVVGAVSGEL